VSVHTASTLINTSSSAPEAQFIVHSLHKFCIKLAWTFLGRGDFIGEYGERRGLSLPTLCYKPLMETHIVGKHYKILYLPPVFQLRPAHN